MNNILETLLPGRSKDPTDYVLIDVGDGFGHVVFYKPDHSLLIFSDEQQRTEAQIANYLLAHDVEIFKSLDEVQTKYGKRIE